MNPVWILFIGKIILSHRMVDDEYLCRFQTTSNIPLSLPFRPAGTDVEKLPEFGKVSKLTRNGFLTKCGIDSNWREHGCGVEIQEEFRWVRIDGSDNRMGNKNGYPLCAECSRIKQIENSLRDREHASETVEIKVDGQTLVFERLPTWMGEGNPG